MYDKKELPTSPEPQHIRTAKDMANHIKGD